MKKLLLLGMIISMILFTSCQETTTSEPIIGEPVAVTINFAPDSVSKNSEFSATLGIVNNGDHEISSGDLAVKIIRDYFRSVNSEVTLYDELNKQSNTILTIEDIAPNVEIQNNEVQRTYELKIEYRFIYGGSSDIVMCFVNPITQYDARKKPICNTANNKISNSKNYIVLSSMDINTGQDYANVVFNIQKVNSNVKLLALDSINFYDIRDYLTDRYKGDKESIKIKFNSIPSEVDATNSYCLIPNEKGGFTNKNLNELGYQYQELFLNGNSAQIKCKFKFLDTTKLDAPNYAFKSYMQIAYKYVVMGTVSKPITIINEEY